jgi:hypothetical protein
MHWYNHKGYTGVAKLEGDYYIGEILGYNCTFFSTSLNGLEPAFKSAVEYLIELYHRTNSHE